MAYPFSMCPGGVGNRTKRLIPRSIGWKPRRSKHRVLKKHSSVTPWWKPRVSMEPLEPRYLLSADLIPIQMGLDGDADDYTLRVANELGEDYVQIVDNLDGEIVDQRLLQNTSGIEIAGNSFSDQVRVDLDSFIPFSLPQGISFQGGAGDDLFELNGLGSNTDIVLSFLGDTGSDTLVGSDADATYAITGVDAGQITGDNSGSFADVENIQGGAGADSFRFEAGGGLSGSIDGGAGDDTLQGADIDNDWEIDGFNAGSLNGVDFSDIENLVGGAADDAFRFIGSGEISGTVDGGAGNNTFDYSASSGDKSVDLGSGDASNVGAFANINNLVGGAGNDTLSGADRANTWQLTELDGGSVNGFNFQGIENLEGGDQGDSFNLELAGGLTGLLSGGLGDDELQAANGSNTWQVSGSDEGTLNALIFSDIENLIGGDLDDAFLFAAAGLVSGTVSGRGGSDRIRAADKENQWSLTSANSGDLNDNAFDQIELLEGGSGSDTLNGPATDTTWYLTGQNAGNVVNTSFTSMETLQGAAGNEDVFVLEPGGSATLLKGGDGGFDTIVVEDGDYSSATYSATGPDSGFITLDGTTTEYSGFEPIVVTGGQDIVIDINTAQPTTTATLTHKSGNTFTLTADDGSFESHDIIILGSTSSVTINMTSGEDTLTVSGLAGEAIDGLLSINMGDGNDTLNLGDGWGDFELDLGAGLDDKIDFSLFTGEVDLDVDLFGNLSLLDAAGTSTINMLSGVKDSLDEILGADFDIDLTADAQQLVTALEGLVELLSDMMSLGDLDAALPLIAKGVEVSIADIVNFVEVMDTVRARLDALITSKLDAALPVTSDDLVNFFNGINGAGDFLLDHLGAVIEATKNVDGVDLSAHTFAVKVVVKRIVDDADQFLPHTINLTPGLADINAVVSDINSELSSLGEEGVRAVNQAGRLVFQVIEGSGIKEMTLQGLNQITEDVLGVSQTIQQLLDVDQVVKNLGQLAIDQANSLIDIGVDIINGLPKLAFSLDFQASRASSFDYDFGSEIVDLGLDFGLGASIDAVADLVADIDLTLALSTTQADAEIDVTEISAGLEITGSAVSGLKSTLGFLSVELNGLVEMDARGTLLLSDSNLSVAELAAGDLSALISGAGLDFTGYDGTGTPSFNVDLTIGVDVSAGTVAGLSGTGKLTASGTDLFSDRNITLTVDADFNTYFAGLNTVVDVACTIVHRQGDRHRTCPIDIDIKADI